jgi:meso-butanediol dehydrogenase/(S,S)-butanediol dehydrogenase/diacetyl reductase
MRLEDKTAIVTGGGSGIGRETALLFGREGASVVVVEYDRDAGGSAAAAVAESGGRSVFVQADVSRPQDVEGVLSAAVDTFGGVDVLVNCAGVLAFGTVIDTDLETWNRIMSVNLTGTYLCCRTVLPVMIRRGGGSIVNLSSSTGAHLAAPNIAAYVASKGGVTALTRAMAIDHAGDGVRVNAIAPGPTDTAMLRDNMSADALAVFQQSFPVKRLGLPAEIALTALFLASDEASFVTGAIFAVDGGQTATV